MRIYSATDVGQKRKMNQDYVFATADPVGNLPNLFVVADGMGGHNAGDYASSHAVTSMVEEIRQDADFNPVKVIRHAIECVNTAFDASLISEMSMVLKPAVLVVTD